MQEFEDLIAQDGFVEQYVCAALTVSIGALLLVSAVLTPIAITARNSGEIDTVQARR